MPRGSDAVREGGEERVADWSAPAHAQPGSVYDRLIDLGVTISLSTSS
jgi:hypothetical protein